MDPNIVETMNVRTLDSSTMRLILDLGDLLEMEKYLSAANVRETTGSTTLQPPVIYLNISVTRSKIAKQYFW